MIAFRINKNSELYEVLSACMKIVKSAKNSVYIPKINSIHYNPATNEIVATDGKRLLCYETDLIKHHINQKVQTSNLTLVGDIVIVEEAKDGYVDYRGLMKRLSFEKTLVVGFVDSYSKPSNEATIQMAYHDIKLPNKAMDIFDSISDLFDRVDIPTEHNQPVRFRSIDYTVQYIISPCSCPNWKIEQGEEKTKEN